MGGDVADGGGQPDLFGFLDALATDYEFEYEFDQRPVEAMDKFFLTEEQKALILYGTLEQIRAHIVAERGQNAAEPDVIMIKMRL